MDHNYGRNGAAGLQNRGGTAGNNYLSTENEDSEQQDDIGKIGKKDPTQPLLPNGSQVSD